MNGIIYLVGLVVVVMAMTVVMCMATGMKNCTHGWIPVGSAWGYLRAATTSAGCTI